MSGSTPSPALVPSPAAPVFGVIPEWTLSGVLPPYLGNPLMPLNMAPYPTTLANVVTRFATTPRRIEIFENFLAYRKRLAAVGIIDGFQWLNGSIFEDIEKLESRDPKDIDVVTFFRRPLGARDPFGWEHFFNLNKQLFSRNANKASHNSDTLYVDLDSSAEDVVMLTRFWFGLFSHRRNDLWKGMLSIQLALSNDDAAAAVILAAKKYGPNPSTGTGP